MSRVNTLSSINMHLVKTIFSCMSDLDRHHALERVTIAHVDRVLRSPSRTPLRRRAASTRASVERVRVAARACDRERDETASFVLNSRCAAAASAAPAHTGDSPRFSVADRHTSPR